MRLSIELTKIQHIKSMSFNIDTSNNNITCIVGKNGSGKTTLIKAIKNLSSANTFARTSSNGIFCNESAIVYNIGSEEYCFRYDPAINGLNCRAAIPSLIKSQIAVELPIPHGERFNFFQTVSEADLDIRRAIILENYTRPNELIEFLADIYFGKSFDNLVEIKINGTNHYCLVLDDNRYIREDYLSSGEYFLISLYRKITGNCKLIVIDEIDISLDAAAQVHLVRKLREFCKKYTTSILFTTHSLAMMRTLDVSELLYMQDDGNDVKIYSASYNYIKSLLFGFAGWDKYILTEDDVLQRFLVYVIQRYCPSIFYVYKIIYVGGGSQVTDLLRRNAQEKFLAEPANVIAVLDGDQKPLRHAQRNSTFCIPIESVEKSFFMRHQMVIFGPWKGKFDDNAKVFYSHVIRNRLMSEMQIFTHLCDWNDDSMNVFANVLAEFLSRPVT